MSCKHKNFWILAGAKYLWCPDCGAIRAVFESGIAEIKPKWNKWLYPKGQEKTLMNWKTLLAKENKKI